MQDWFRIIFIINVESKLQNVSEEMSFWTNVHKKLFFHSVITCKVHHLVCVILRRSFDLFLLRLVITSSFQLPSSTEHSTRGLRFAPTNMQQCNLPFIHLVFCWRSFQFKCVWKTLYDGFVVAYTHRMLFYV